MSASIAGYRTIIWDWNGTLLNDALACCRIINIVLKRCGLPVISDQRYREIFDFPVREYYARLGFDFNKDPFEKVGSEFITHYEKQRHRLRLQPGARALIHRLHKRGVDQVILSAYRTDTLHSLLEEKKLHALFTHIVGADDHYARGKKDQGIALLKKLRLDRRSTLLVGDTIHDADVAEAMGVDCVLIDAGHQSRHRLERCGVPVLNDLNALGRRLRM